MGATKYELYSDELINTAGLLKAIAHPARLKALLIIANETDKDVTIKDIAKEIKLSQSTLSVHLKQLHSSGLIKTAVTTNESKCCKVFRVNKLAFTHLINLLEHLLKKVDLKKDDRYESFSHFYSKLTSIHNWNQCFES